MPYPVEAIANEFIDRAMKEPRQITNMQLQKLPFFAHGWGLVVLKDRLVEELPEARDYGPVYRRLYNSLRKYGAGPVTDYIRENDYLAFAAPSMRGDIVRAQLRDVEQQLVNVVWDSYKGYSAYDLSALTHRAGAPWATARSLGINSIITDRMMEEYFDGIASGTENASGESKVAS